MMRPVPVRTVRHLAQCGLVMSAAAPQVVQPSPPTASACRGVSPSCIVAVLVGFILVAAAGLKLFEQVAQSAPSSESILQARWVRLFLIELEACLGICLIIGYCPSISRSLAIVVFSMFAIVNVWQTWFGAASCNCFGLIHIHPLIVLTVDAVVIGALMAFKAAASTKPVSSASARRRVGVRSGAIVAIGMLLFAGGVTARLYFRPPPDLVEHLVIEPTIRDFGVVRENESLTHAFTVRNDWTGPVQVVRMHTTCSCTLADDFVGRILAPGEASSLKVTFKPGQQEGSRSAGITLFFQGSGTTVPAWKSLEVRARVGTDYQVIPTSVDFGPMNQVGHKVELIRLRPKMMPGVQITRLESDNPIITARQLRGRETDSDSQIEVDATR
jgi:hypothetical protein